MGRSLQSHSVVATAVILMAAVWLMRACLADSKVCTDCIRDRMQLDCPACAPPLRCMAQCLWGGGARSRCVKRCDCGGASASLATCRQCMSRCKCNCSSSSRV